MNKLWLITIPILVMGFCFGVCYGTTEPQVITQTIIKEVPVEVIREVEVTKYVEVVKRSQIIKEVEVIKEIPLEVRYFENTRELREWLAQDDTDQVLIMGWDCDDYARALAEQAIKDGYWIYIQQRGNHMLNSTIIGNKFYYIEPQHDKYWIWCSLD